MTTFANIKNEEGFKNQDKIFKMVEDVVKELNIGHKLEDIIIKHPPSGPPIDMNYLSSDEKSLDLEIVDSLDNLEGRIRHELMHVADQLDEEFKYNAVLIPVEGTGDFRRYKYLWNVYIDSRLEREKKPAYETRENREKEMEECYPELSEELRKKIFDFLWKLTPLNFTQITDMSRNLLSASEEINTLAQPHSERVLCFKTLDDLKNYKR